MDEPIIRLSGKVPKPYFAFYAFSDFLLRQGQLPDAHAMRGISGFPAIFHQANGQSRFTDAGLATQDHLITELKRRVLNRALVMLERSAGKARSLRSEGPGEGDLA
jgi:hypothetical protein